MSLRVVPDPSPIRLPKYRLRVIRGQEWAYVTLPDSARKSRIDVNLGRYGSPESRERYQARIAEWLAAGGGIRQPRRRLAGMTVNELCYAWLREVIAEQRYPAKHMARMKRYIAVLCRAYGSTVAASFGPLALKAWRHSLLRADAASRRVAWCHSTAKDAAQAVVSIFRWGVSREIVAASAWEALRSLERLRRPAGPATRVLPATPRAVALTLRHLRGPVAAMVRLQWVTGMRPGEVCQMRPVDLERRRGGDWVYRPRLSKGQWMGREREVRIGPKGRRLLAPLIEGASVPDAYLFRPADAMSEMRQQRAASRVTPMGQGNGPGTHRSPDPRRLPRECYDVASYRRAIWRACDRAGVARWSPHQLRHSFATRMRQRVGLEAAQLALGHSSARVTDAVYAERSVKLIRDAIERIG